MKISIVRDKPINFGGGIKKHCDDLYNLFYNDTNLQIVKIVDFPFWHIPILNKSITRFDCLYQHLKSSNCDVVHIHGFMSIIVIQAFIVAKIQKKRIIYSPHFHPFEYLRCPFLGRIFFHIFIKPLLSFAEKIVTINNEDTNFFKKYHKNVYKVPHWTNEVKETSIVNRKKNMILFIGRNDSNKGLEHLYSLPRDKYEIHCVTGGVLKRDDFIQHKNISNKELSILYQEASIVVVPSRYEAFSLVALEALMHKVPIIISDRVRIGDYLLGDKGFRIFKYSDYKDFNKSITEILKDENIDFSSLIKPFSIEHIKITYETIYT